MFTNELNYSQEAGNIAGAMLRKPEANWFVFFKEIRKLHFLDQQNCEKIKVRLLVKGMRKNVLVLAIAFAYLHTVN